MAKLKNYENIIGNMEQTKNKVYSHITGEYQCKFPFTIVKTLSEGKWYWHMGDSFITEKDKQIILDLFNSGKIKTKY